MKIWGLFMVKNLSILRNKIGKSQRQVAIDLSIKYTTYYNWESGDAEPSIENLIKLADYFCVSVDYLIGRESRINLENMPNEQSKVINKFTSLNESNQTKVAGYVDSLYESEKK